MLGLLRLISAPTQGSFDLATSFPALLVPRAGSQFLHLGNCTKRRRGSEVSFGTSAQGASPWVQALLGKVRVWGLCWGHGERAWGRTAASGLQWWDFSEMGKEEVRNLPWLQTFPETPFPHQY